ncbi:MAG: hypothetical protein HWD59_02745 [Coxiellaceae bacterium]|nr:MAG: hypothetical protein HWD59_02745 [Coxiellaceae bacterium]
MVVLVVAFFVLRLPAALRGLAFLATLRVLVLVVRFLVVRLAAGFLAVLRLVVALRPAF